tara:strand:- start:2874 stop:3326 length:453 start_codon:yes stop_codon:yes gene_type:complete
MNKETEKFNLELWNEVSTSDKKYLKDVSYGQRKFTAIDAHYQIKAMTQKFGPVGGGWGYSVDTIIHNLSPDDTVVIANVSVWHSGSPNNVFGPVSGCKSLMRNGKVDEDAPKKAMTDGLTKALSHLGFNADVFLGEFDGNKYTDKDKPDW